MSIFSLFCFSGKLQTANLHLPKKMGFAIGWRRWGLIRRRRTELGSVFATSSQHGDLLKSVANGDYTAFQAISTWIKWWLATFRTASVFVLPLRSSPLAIGGSWLPYRKILSCWLGSEKQLWPGGANTAARSRPLGEGNGIAIFNCCPTLKRSQWPIFRSMTKQPSTQIVCPAYPQRNHDTQWQPGQLVGLSNTKIEKHIAKICSTLFYHISTTCA